MELEAYQRALLGLCFAPREPPELPGFGLYRELVRSRFLGMARMAFRGTCALLGERAFVDSFAGYLAATPPTSPYIREVIAAFASYAELDRTLLAAAPHARCLLRFEAAKWQVANASATVDAAVREVDFDGVLVLNPTLRALELEYLVAESDTPARDPHMLLVYRRPDHDDVRWYRASPVLAELLAQALGEPQPLATLVQNIGAKHSRDQELLEGLASALTVAVERGVVLGVR